MRALAARRFCSAARTSGRRLRTSAGSPARMDGMAGDGRAAGNGEIRRAAAAKHGERVFGGTALALDERRDRCSRVPVRCGPGWWRARRSGRRRPCFSGGRACFWRLWIVSWSTASWASSPRSRKYWRATSVATPRRCESNKASAAAAWALDASSRRLLRPQRSGS